MMVITCVLWVANSALTFMKENDVFWLNGLTSVFLALCMYAQLNS